MESQVRRRTHTARILTMKMTASTRSAMAVFRGWDGYQKSLVHAVAPLSRELLAWRGEAHLRSVGEIASHISQGRIWWFHRVLGQGSPDFAGQVAALRPDEFNAIVENAAELVRWLEATWRVIEEALEAWTVDDLDKTLVQPYGGKTYAIPRQWIVWRIMAHDMHHGGELAFALGMQGVRIPELGDMGGHITEPPLAQL